MSHLISNSIFSALNYEIASCLWTIVASPPSTGKSIGLNFIQRAFEEIERFNEVANHDTQQVNALNIEFTLTIMDKIPALIGIN